MYVEPNTLVRILHNVPLDNTYDHTIYFTNATEQANYFAGKTKYTIERNTYQRVNRGSIRVGIPADNLYDCNYIMFWNKGFGTKWFYAFITAVEYVNNDTSIIAFEVDDMQTWAFDYELEQCFVEREHTETDVIGEHTVPEGLELGGYITTNENALTSDWYSITILATEPVPLDTDVSPQPSPMSEPGIVDGYPLPLYYKHILTPDVLGSLNTDLISTIKAYSRAGKANAIVAIFTHPKQSSESSNIATRTLPANVSVRNNKMYCYPFCCAEVTCGASNMELKYELFSSTPSVQLHTCTVSPSASITVIPLNYEGMAEDYSRAISLKGFPPVPWINNYFQNWYAQNAGLIHVGMLSDINTISGGASQLGSSIASLMFGVGSVTGGASGVGGAVTKMNSGIISTLGRLAEVYKHNVMPNTMGGVIDSVDNLFADGELKVRSYCRTIRPEYFRIIDDFFTKFGYKVNRNKVPNTHSRPHWNYVKTISCTVKGSMPADSMRHVCSIFDNGITFWKNGDEIGNYNLDNTP